MKNGTSLFRVTKRGRKKDTARKNFNCEDVIITSEFNHSQGKKKNIAHWWLYSLENISISHGISFDKRVRRKQQVDLAIRKRSTKQRTNTLAHHSYCTLPIKETELGFSYNAKHFYVTTYRAEFQKKEGKEREWNEWQMKNLSRLLRFATQHLISKGRSPDEVYPILPTKQEYADEFEELLAQEFHKEAMGMNLPLFFTTENKWVQGRSKSGDVTAYSTKSRFHQDFLPPKEFPHFIKYALERRYSSLLVYYGAKHLEKQDVLAYLEKYAKTTDFKRRFGGKLTKEKAKGLESLYSYLISLHLSKEEREKLKSLDLFLNEEGELRSIKYGIYSPPDNTMPLIDDDDIIHSYFWDKKNFMQFFRTMGIKKMDMHDLIVDSFLRRTHNSPTKFDFVLYMIRHQKEVMKKQDTRNKLIEKRHDYLDVEHNDASDPDIYFPSPALKQIFQERLNYLSLQYQSSCKKRKLDYRPFFKKIGVKDFPSTQKVIDIIRSIDEEGYTDENAYLAEQLFVFIRKNLSKVSSKESRDNLLRELNSYKWLPTASNDVSIPRYTYCDQSLMGYVGAEAPILRFRIHKEDKLAKFLDMRRTPGTEDVVNFLNQHEADYNNGKDKAVNFRIYEYLNSNLNSLDSELVDRLKRHRVIWTKNRLWFPHQVFTENCFHEFGPNGYVRAYLHNSKLKEYSNLISFLDIQSKPAETLHHVQFLLDISKLHSAIDNEKWSSRVTAANREVANRGDYIDYKEQLADSRIIMCQKHLRKPEECYLVRNSERIFLEKTTTSGIAEISYVLVDSAKEESYYLDINMEQISENVFQKYEAGEEVEVSDFSASLSERISGLRPWLNGYAYREKGEAGIMELSLFDSLKVKEVTGLKTSYHLRYSNEIINGFPIKDDFCFDMDDETLYVDTDFDSDNQDQIAFLAMMLSRSVTLKGDITRAQINLAVASYLLNGKIPMVTPYNESISQSLVHEVEEEFDEEEVPEEETYESDNEEGSKKIGPPRKPTVGKKQRKDGLKKPPTKPKSDKKKKKRKKPKAAMHRGGAPLTPHAVNFDEECEWVRNQEGCFCQVCVLFCEECAQKPSDGDCVCEVKKNAENAFEHHHLEPRKGDPNKDVKGNIAILCKYHHKIMDKVDLRLGYLNDKIEIVESESFATLIIYPESEFEDMIRIKFSKKHFEEFISFIGRPLEK